MNQNREHNWGRVWPLVEQEGVDEWGGGVVREEIERL